MLRFGWRPDSGSTRHVDLGRKLIAEHAHDGTIRYVHTDALGSPVARSGANGQELPSSRTRYEPYGATVAGSTNPTGIGFTGHVNDADTGLVYMQQRYYDPLAARFLSVDPVVTDQKNAEYFNRYEYAESNPYKFTDPDGRRAKVAEKAIAAIVRVLTGDGGQKAPKPPNKDGKKGGPAHQEKVSEIKKDVENRELQAKTEFKVETPGGEKESRYIDVAAIDPKTGRPVEFHQAGKANKDGTPVSRERKAANDVKERAKQAELRDVPITHHNTN